MRSLKLKLPPFRPLPLSIAAMLVLTMVKLANVAQSFGPTLASAGANAGRTMMPSAIAAEPQRETAAPITTPLPPPVTEPSAAPGPSEAERALLLDLRARRDALDTRTQALDSRDGLLKAAERGLADRLGQLAAMQTRLETMEKSRRELDEANWRGLVKTYETMRPRDAAVIFNDLDQPVLMQVLDRMKETKAAPVLASMQPDRARAATMQLAKWRSRAAGGSPE